MKFQSLRRNFWKTLAFKVIKRDSQVNLKEMAANKRRKMDLLKIENKFVCSYCPSIFTRKYNLERHIKRLHPQRNGSTIAVVSAVEDDAEKQFSIDDDSHSNFDDFQIGTEVGMETSRESLSPAPGKSISDEYDREWTDL